MQLEEIVKSGKITLKIMELLSNEIAVQIVVILYSLGTCFSATVTKGKVSAHNNVSTNFEYYSKYNPSVIVHKDYIESKLAKKVIFYIHGWMAGKNLDESDSRKIKDGIFKNRNDVDIVVLVDWIEASNNWYYFTVAKESVPIVAENVKNEIEWLHQTHGILTSKIEMVAHSLGAHIMGQAGKLWNGKGLDSPIAKMTALDAAGPAFRENPEVRICKADAEFVRAIHTDNRYGIFEDVGHEDIYPYTQDVILNCEKQMNDHICLHRAAKDLYLQELGGAILVDPKDPKKGKDRFKKAQEVQLNSNHHLRYVNVLVLDDSRMQEKGRMKSMIITTKQRYITNFRPIKLPTKIVEFNTLQGTDFIFDQGIGKDAQFFISSPDYDKIIPELTTPHGFVFKSSEFSMDGELHGIYINIPYALPGKWNLKLYSDGDESNKQEKTHDDDTTSKIPLPIVFVTMMQNTENEIPIRLDGRLSSNRIDYNSTEIVKIEAVVRKGDDLILGAHVEAFLTPSFGNEIISLVLLDNGGGSDEIKNDGVYSGQLVQQLALGIRYSVSVTATVGRNTKIMPAEKISFMTPEPSEVEQFADAYPFERQIRVGSIKAISEYKQALPNTIRDLKIVHVDLPNRLCSLIWTAAGNSGDFGKASSLEIRATTNFTQASQPGYNADSFLFKTNMTVGNLEPLFAGDMQNITLEIPEQLWNQSDHGLHLYFTVRTQNNELKFSDDSNIASALYALGAVHELPEPQVVSHLVILIAFWGTAAIVCVFFCVCQK